MALTTPPIPEFRCSLILTRGSSLHKTYHDDMGEAMFWLGEQSRQGFDYQTAECYWNGVRQFRVEID